MSEGFGRSNVRVVDTTTGETLDDVLLPMEPELWDRDRRRLTVLLDPGRIKRGLEPHAEAGYPLRSGVTIDVAVDEGFLDGDGRRLRTPGSRRYVVGDDLRGRVDPASWVVSPPRSATRDALRLDFGRPLDHALLRRCLAVVDGEDIALGGEGNPSDGETSWSFVPEGEWAPGEHHVVIDPILEDVAGNSVRRVFDRDLERPQDDPVDGGAGRLSFRPRHPAAT
jgi:hypothetical protein